MFLPWKSPKKAEGILSTPTDISSSALMSPERSMSAIITGTLPVEGFVYSEIAPHAATFPNGFMFAIAATSISPPTLSK
ncbi:unnamed protein product [Citrullus colocynthis]|uniref:Uncharacterized protein n=1 Tax=Citrullus colocynthis TaxID=252529 RepID=A0ABP0ZA11_9ROSI